MAKAECRHLLGPDPAVDQMSSHGVGTPLRQSLVPCRVAIGVCMSFDRHDSAWTRAQSRCQGLEPGDRWLIQVRAGRGKANCARSRDIRQLVTGHRHRGAGASAARAGNKGWASVAGASTVGGTTTFVTSFLVSSFLVTSADTSSAVEGAGRGSSSTTRCVGSGATPRRRCSFSCGRLDRQWHLGTLADDFGTGRRIDGAGDDAARAGASGRGAIARTRRHSRPRAEDLRCRS